jgi:hypothetical protein
MRRPRFFWEKGNGGNGNGNGKKAALSRRALFEPLEPPPPFRETLSLLPQPERPSI